MVNTYLLGRRHRLPFMHDHPKEVKHSIVEWYWKNMQVVEETCQNQNLKTKTTTADHCKIYIYTNIQYTNIIYSDIPILGLEDNEASDWNPIMHYFLFDPATCFIRKSRMHIPYQFSTGWKKNLCNKKNLQRNTRIGNFYEPTGLKQITSWCELPMFLHIRSVITCQHPGEKVSWSSICFWWKVFGVEIIAQFRWPWRG